MTPQPTTEPVVRCALCAAAALGPPLTWMFENDPRRGGVWYCDHCSRMNLRSVEAKLDQQWW